MRVFYLADVADLDRSPALADAHGELVHLLHMPHHAVGVDLVVELADLGVAGRDERVEVLERADHVHGRKVAHRQLVAIDIGQNAADAASVHRRRDHTANALQSVAQLEVGDVVELGFVVARATDAHQTQRHAGRWVEGHDHRRNRARRQVIHVGDGQRRHLRHGGVGVDVGTEVIAHDAHAVHRTRFLVGDTVGLTGPAFEAAGDVFLHHLRGHAGIERQHLHGRRFEGGQNVSGNASGRNDAQQNDGQSADNDRMRVSERAGNHKVAPILAPSRAGCGSVAARRRETRSA